MGQRTELNKKVLIRKTLEQYILSKEKADAKALKKRGTWCTQGIERPVWFTYSRSRFLA